MHGTHNLAFGRTGIQDNLRARTFCLEGIENLREHLYGRADRNGENSDISLVYSFFQAHHLIHEANLQSSRSIHTVLLHSQDAGRETSSLQIYGHRTANESKAYYRYCHNKAPILSSACLSTGAVAQSEALM